MFKGDSVKFKTRLKETTLHKPIHGVDSKNRTKLLLELGRLHRQMHVVLFALDRLEQ